MIHDDFNFSFDSSDFPVSIEEFAAYMDGNLTDDEMQRVSTVIEHDDTMQDVLDSMEQSELTLAEYEQEDMELPEEIAGGDFDVPEIDDYYVGSGGFFHPYAEVAACAACPIILDHAIMMEEDNLSLKDFSGSSEKMEDFSDNVADTPSDINEDTTINT